MWADNTKLEYVNWNLGEPSDSDTELCGEMIDWPNDESNGKWNDLDCSQTRAYGCELYPSKCVVPMLSQRKYELLVCIYVFCVSRHPIVYVCFLVSFSSFSYFHYFGLLCVPVLLLKYTTLRE